MKVAIEGCCHGQLDQIYQHIADLETKNNYKVDILLICGDFQAIRNPRDLQCMAVPQKYRTLGGFHKYYTGQKTAPLLTLVIGGNHEASNYMWELYHGGWLAPNIYYLGAAGSVLVNGIRIAGASGIFNQAHYRSGNFESLPYSDGGMRSIYHTRQYCMSKLAQLANSPVDIFLSHDWPQGIEHHGNLQQLLRAKPFFKSDIQSGRLGSPPLMQLLRTIQPKHWFSAHLHVRFQASIDHSAPTQQAAPAAMEVAANPDEIVIDDLDNTDEIAIDESTLNDAPVPKPTQQNNPDQINIEDDEPEPNASSTAPVTKPIAPAQQQLPSKTDFLALDKCLPNRKFLEVIDIPSPESSSSSNTTLTFDANWLAITRAFHPYLSLGREQMPLPDPDTASSMVKAELEWVKEHVTIEKILDVQQFTPTAPGGPGTPKKGGNQQPPAYLNPQTVALCELLGIENKINEDGLRTLVPPPKKELVPKPTLEPHLSEESAPPTTFPTTGAYDPSMPPVN